MAKDLTEALIADRVQTPEGREGMTVADLIAKLQALPQDLPVKVLDAEWNEYWEPATPQIVSLRMHKAGSGIAVSASDDWRGGRGAGEPFNAVVLECAWNDKLGDTAMS